MLALIMANLDKPEESNQCYSIIKKVFLAVGCSEPSNPTVTSRRLSYTLYMRRNVNSFYDVPLICVPSECEMVSGKQFSLLETPHVDSVQSL